MELIERCTKSSSWETMSDEVLALVLVHLLGDPPPPASHWAKVKKVDNNVKVKVTNKGYKDSWIVTPEHLNRLSLDAAALVSATLWFADFKWRGVGKDGGVWTRVHFGRAERYGGHAPAVAELESFKLNDGVLKFVQGNRKIKRIIELIEVPPSRGNYIFMS
jgi:hypothetical protein